jgi:hypothetical protein
MMVLWMLLGCSRAVPQFPDPTEDLLHRLDQDGSGTLSAQELRGYNAFRVMSFVDRDRDNQVSLVELRTIMGRVGDLPVKGGKAKGKMPPPPPPPHPPEP